MNAASLKSLDGDFRCRNTFLDQVADFLAIAEYFNTILGFRDSLSATFETLLHVAPEKE